MAAKCPECGARFIQIDEGDTVPTHTPLGERGRTCPGSGESANADN
jgi:hypothetical protein